MQVRNQHSASSAFYLAFRSWYLSTRASSNIQIRHTIDQRRHCNAKRRAGRDTSIARHHAQGRTFSTSAALERGDINCGKIGMDLRPGIKQSSRSSVTLSTGHRRQYTQKLATNLTSTSENNGLIDAMRESLRAFTKPCVLVTTCTAIEDIRTYSGITLSSFDAVTLHPEPHVAFNIRVPSRTYETFEASGIICVHILSANADGAAIADAFTKPYESSHEPFELLMTNGAALMHSKEETVPRLANKAGILSWLVCERSSTTPEVSIGDHRICTFKVKQILSSEPTLLPQQALAYGQRAYRALGEQIVLGSHPHNTQARSSSRPSIKSTQPTQRSVLTTLANRTETTFNRIASAAFHMSHLRLTDDMGIFRPFSWTQEDDQDDRRHIDKGNTRDTHQTQRQSDEEVMKQTVEDLLCHSTSRPAQRMGRLRQARERSEQATSELSIAMKEGRITAYESERLEKIIEDNERYIDRTLAHRAAYDLREMLDNGRVSKSRVQFLEACIEKGQAALIKETRDLVAGVPRDGISLAVLPSTREAFEKEDALLNTELMRLRELMEEEDHNNDDEW